MSEPTMTNRQFALQMAIKANEGLKPSGRSTYSAKVLSNMHQRLADRFYAWLEDEPFVEEGSEDA